MLCMLNLFEITYIHMELHTYVHNKKSNIESVICTARALSLFSQAIAQVWSSAPPSVTRTS